MSEILAAIDIGTNSLHLVVAEIKDNRFVILTRDKEVVRLGSSSKDMKHLTPEAVERGIIALKRFKLVCDSYNASIRAVATSAVREAENKSIFIDRAKKEAGIEVEIISGYEEARLIYLGVLQALDVFNKKILLIDIGGGSTEFLAGYKGSIAFAQSVKIGAVRLTNKFFPDGKVTDKSVEEAENHIKAVIHPVIRGLQNEKFDCIVGTSGTITSIAEIINPVGETGDDNFSFNNYCFNKKDLQKAAGKILKASTTEERLKLPGLDSKRADIIPAGSLILKTIFASLDIEEITVSSYALREGIIFDTISKAASIDTIGHLNDVRYASIQRLANAAHYNKEHAEQTTRLALKIFTALKEKFNLSEKDEEHLEAACILHDIGYYISHSAHHKHSYYLIRNTELLGFTDNEIEIIANIARYHRKSLPKAKHEAFAKLSEESQLKVKQLAGILRIADGLDRSHKSLIKDLNIKLKKSLLDIKIVTEPEANIELEIWGAEQRKDLFEETYCLKLQLTA